MSDKTNKDWTETAKDVIGKLTKVANDQLDTASGTVQGTASPEEVVSALEVIINELSAVMSAIPAQKQEEEAPTPQTPAPVEEKEVVAKLQTEVKELTAKLEATEKESVAVKYAELFEDPKVSQDKYDEVIKSDKPSKDWSDKIASIEEFRTASKTQPYKPAQSISKFIRVAQQDRITHL